MAQNGPLVTFAFEHQLPQLWRFLPLCVDFHLAYSPTYANHCCAFSTQLCPKTSRACRFPHFGFSLTIGCFRPHLDQRHLKWVPTMEVMWIIEEGAPPWV